MDFREETDALNQIPIRTVAAWLGLKLPPRGTVRCPFYDHNDSNPSFEVKSSGNRWRCYGCNRSGGSIDFVKIYRALEFLEAKRWLADCAAVSPSTAPRLQTNTLKSATPSRKDDADTPPDHEVYEKLLQLAPLQPSGREYLSSRGFSDKTMTTFGVGQLTNKNAILAELIRVYGFARLNDAGLLTKRSSPRDIRLVFPAGSLLFPFFEKRSVKYLQARVIRSVSTTGKWRNLSYRKRRIYNADALFDTEAGTLAICEGIMDTWSAIELGYCGVGLMGISAKLSVEQLIQLRGRQVYILLDWDPSGDDKSEELRRQMRRFGISSTRKNRPSTKATDLNEYLVELSKQR